MRAWRNDQPVRIAGRERHVRDPLAVVDHDARLGRDLLGHRGAERTAVRGRDIGFLPRHRRREAERVDLAMRVRDRRTHARAAVLEHEHVLDLRTIEQCLRAFGPEIHDCPSPVDADRRERSVVLARVEHDLGRTARGSVENPVAASGARIDRRAGLERWPPVRERSHRVRIGCFEPTHAERARGCGQVRPRLAIPDDRHPLPREWIQPELAHWLPRLTESRGAPRRRSGPGLRRRRARASRG